MPFRIDDADHCKQMFAHAQWGIAIGSADGKHLELVNPTYARMHGYEVDELIGQPISTVFPPDLWPTIPQNIALNHEQGHRRFETLHQHRDGTVFPVHVDVTTIRDETGAVSYRIVHVLDVSERKAAEEALQHSESLLSLVLNTLPLGLQISDCSGRPVSSNPAWTALFADAPNPFRAALAKGTPVPAQILVLERDDGKPPRQVRTQCAPLLGETGQLEGSITLAEDVTKQERAAERIRLSQAFFKSIFDFAAVGMAIADLDGRYIGVNQAMCDYVGYSEAELLTMRYHDITYPDDLTPNVEQRARMLAGDLQTFQQEKRYVRKDGRIVWALMVVSVILDKTGTPLYSLGQMLDIDQQKRSEAQLRTSQAKLARAQQLAHLGDWELDLRSRRFSCSAEMRRMFGLTEGEIFENLELDVLPRLHPADLAFAQQAIHDAQAHVPWSVLEYRVLRPDGRECTLLAHKQMEYAADGTPLRAFGTTQDITERKAIERALEQSNTQLRNMATHQQDLIEAERKRIAREVHDELGQRLTALKLDISLMRMQHGNDSRLLDQTARMSELIDETIDVVRDVATRLRPAALDLGVTAAIEWLVDEMRQHAGVECRFDTDCSDVVLMEGQATAVFRVVQESLTNIARHARASRVLIRLHRRPACLHLSIEDDGCGFSPATVDNVNAFGVIGMRERALSLGSELHIDSLPGRGTAIALEIPLTAGAPQ